MDKHILVTGGAGFIGTNFVHLILNKCNYCNVTVLDRLTYAGNLKNLAKWNGDSRYKFIHGDIADRDFIFKLFNENEFSHVAHFAAESHVDRSILGPEEFVRTNINGTYNILEGLRQAGWGSDSENKRMLHVSTDEVFGSLGNEGYFSEETCYAPNSPYSASKAASDHLVRAYFHTYGFPVITSNCSNNYGPYQFPEKLIPLMTINALQGKPLPVYGTGTNIRDWLHVEDHCTALDAILFRGKIGETYNIGTRNEKTNLDIVNTICSIMDEIRPDNRPHGDLIKFVADRPGHDFRYAIDPTKIENELGWKPVHNFKDGIKNTIEWYLTNQSWWEDILSGEYQNYYIKQYGMERNK